MPIFLGYTANTIPVIMLGSSVVKKTRGRGLVSEDSGPLKGWADNSRNQNWEVIRPWRPGRLIDPINCQKLSSVSQAVAAPNADSHIRITILLNCEQESFLLYVIY